MLLKERGEIHHEFDERIDKFKKQVQADNEKKKDSQYDYKQKEKELKDHLETMTSVAQRIDDENRVLMKKNQELKI